MLECSTISLNQRSGKGLKAFKDILEYAMTTPNAIIYTNYELPESQRQQLEKYATVQRINKKVIVMGIKK